jgi:CheY-specific phosphatase CheX
MLYEMFGEHFQCDSSLEEVSLPPCKDYIISIQLKGEKLEAELIYTIDSETATNLLGNLGISLDDYEQQRQLMHSALGELANVVAGQLITYKSFTNVFGKVSVRPSTVWDAESDEVCIPLREGVSSYVQHKQTTIPTFISCTAVNTVDIKINDYTSPDRQATQRLTISNFT